MRGGDQQHSVRRSAWLIVAAALVPLLLFSIFQIGYSAREQRRVLEATALSDTKAVILRADGEVLRLQTLLDAMGTSAVLERGDFAAFRARVTRFFVLHKDVVAIEVRDARSGALLSASGRVDGQRLRAADGPPSMQTRFVGYATSPACRCLMFERTGVSGGRPVTLILLSRSETFVALLPPPRDFEVSALVGPKGRFLARTLKHDERFAQLSSQFVRDAVTSGKVSGLYRGRTLEGLENYTAFHRSGRTGWTAHLALGSDYIDSPARRYLASLGVAGILSLLLAGLLIAFAIRQILAARRLSERLQQAQKMEALGQLTGGIAHDFNNLLTPVIGTLDQLRRREGLDERGRRLAAGALSSAERAARLTQQLLAFSRRQRLAIAPIDVPLLLEGVTALVQRSISGKHPFRVEADPRARCVQSDRNQLELALLNLAINARDASPEGSPIVLRVTAEGERPDGDPERVVFAVADLGSGMNEATKARALEPFFTTKPAGRGTGLGLAQVFGVVEQSGGSVAIDSVPGEGTVVTLSLPAGTSSEVPPVPSTQEAASHPDLRPLRLLVVDDDAEVRTTIAQMLTERGHAVDAVAHGTTALAALAAEPFDLVIADFLMPMMNGAELIEEARRVRPGAKFLIVTGFADSDALRRACLDTATLAKPFTSGQLIAAVARSLGEGLSQPED